LRPRNGSAGKTVKLIAAAFGPAHLHDSIDRQSESGTIRELALVR